MALEADIQRSILDYLGYKHLFHWRQNSGAMPVDIGGSRRFLRFGAVGAPDIFVVKGGAIYALEVKSPTGKQNDNQKKFQEGFEAAGGRYFVVRSLEDVQIIGL